MNSLPKEDNEVYPEDRMFDTYRLEKRFRITDLMLKAALGLDGKIKSMSWDQGHCILTIYLETHELRYSVAEGAMSPECSAAELRPFGLTIEQIYEAQQETKDEIHED